MKQIQSSRRTFVGTIAAGATGLLSVPATMLAKSVETPGGSDAEAWFKKVKGKHRIVYDATEPHNGFPMIWTWVFYKTNNETGTPDDDMTAVVVLRHNAIPYAMEDRLWEKYKFGETFKIIDNNTNMSAMRNPLWLPKEKDYPLPGIDGIKALQDRGAMFCVCDMAIKVYSGFAAKEMEADPEEVRKDWLSGIHPGIQVVPSGVWAVGRAQENGCAYCYAGG
ncbi:MAG TPA: Tat (twin-arginine translocation) pathway signal sequence containing protein [Chryseosolibacter sp.]|nr:Tat (twin-arginine translocation) pathway signal sequence containing protein [Chryseosolibacter sp.]